MCKAAVVALVIAIAGCSERPPAAPPAPQPTIDQKKAPELPSDANQRLDALVRQNLEAELAAAPVTATWLGAHQLDDRLDDVRLDAQGREVARLRTLIERLRAIDGAALDPQRAIDRLLLERRSEAALFELTDLRPLERDPIFYIDLAQGAVSELLADENPPVDRVRALTSRLWRVRPLLDEARRNLRGTTPELVARRAIELGQEAKNFFGETLPKAIQPADAKLANDFREACGDSSRALDDFVGWLSRDLLPRAHGDVALGRGRLQERLRLVEGIEVTPEQLAAAGERELKDARHRYDDAVRALTAGHAGADALKLIEEDHAKPEELTSQAQSTVESIAAFVKAQHLVTLPDPERPKVLDMPPALWGYVQLSAPGPLDPKPREAFLYIDPVDKSWPDRRKQEHLRALNRSMLVLSLAHEYVGRFVLGERDRRAPTTMQKISLAPAFVDGWSSYVERMLLDEGYAPGDARMRISVERALMLRAARLVAVIRLHALAAKPDDLIKLFTDEALCDDAQARREVERAALDPMILTDALGRLELEKLRDDWRAAHPDATLGQFHDALLSHGTPPITILRKLLLPGDQRSPL